MDRRSLRKQIAVALPGVAVIAAVGITRSVGLLQSMELTALDTFLRLRPPEPLDERVVVLGINEADIQQVGAYPIPDRELAQAITTLQQFQPTAIGFDIVRDLPVEPGGAELAAAFRTYSNIIAGEIAAPDLATGRPVKAPPSVPVERVGAADAVLDTDGSLRRSLLGLGNAQQEFRESLAVKLTDVYLARHRPNLFIENGIRDPNAMRIGTIEFDRLQSNTGGYVGADASGYQILLNFRSGRAPFRVISLQDLKLGKVRQEWIHDRVVLIGITAPSVNDQVISGAVPLPRTNRGFISGVEFQAHSVSQILSAVLDKRPLLQAWSKGWEYLWILVWGALGIAIGRAVRSPWKGSFLLGLLGLLLLGSAYALLLIGWWVPVVPALLILTLNGTGLVIGLFYRAEQILERQLVVEELFTEIHNRPLQTLKQLQRKFPDHVAPDHPLLAELKQVDRELRAVYDSARQELLRQNSQLRLGGDRALDLQTPLHEILHEIYYDTLERDFPHFKTLKVKVVEFKPMDDRRLSLAHKRGLCRFLEEALCNVGKYAVGATRLQVTCAQEGDLLVIRVIDNGVGVDQTEAVPVDQSSGFGTRHAKNLAKRLGGSFRRIPKEPKGTICELSWSAKRFRFWPG